MDSKLIQQMCDISLSMFRENFFGVFHGSISAKLENNRFVINKKDAIFDEMTDSSLITLYRARDHRWKEASMDALIHSNIYENISDAKYIAYGMPPYATAYATKYSRIYPIDYFGVKILGKIDVYNPKELETWYERADVEIYRYMKEHNTKIMVIRGYGVYVCHRDINQMAKLMAVLENSCRLLYLNAALSRDLQAESCDLYLI